MQNTNYTINVKLSHIAFSLFIIIPLLQYTITWSHYRITVSDICSCIFISYDYKYFSEMHKTETQKTLQ